MTDMIQTLEAKHYLVLGLVTLLALGGGAAVLTGPTDDAPADADERGLTAYTVNETANGSTTITFRGNDSVDALTVRTARTNTTHTLSAPNESLTLNTTQTGPLTFVRINRTGDGETETSTMTYTPTTLTATLTPRTATVAVGDTVTFTASATPSTPNGTLQFAWDTDGDGTFERTTANQTTAVTVSTPGTHTVRVRVTTGQQSVVRTTTVTAVNSPPQLTLTVPANATVNESVTASVATLDPDAQPLTIHWARDNTTVTGQTGATLTTTFTTVGTHTITVRVSDGYTTTTATQSITVVEPTTTSNTTSDSSNSSNSSNSSTTYIITVEDGSGGDSDSDSDSDAAVSVSASPDFAVYNNTSAEFSATADTGDPPFTYNWTFGDGQTGVGTNPTHWYATRGTYTAAVTVTDDDGDTATADVNVTVENTPPVAAAGPNLTVTDNESFTLTATNSSDYDGDNLTYTWHTATGATATGPNLTTAYDAFGTYTHTVNVTDSYNDSDTASVTVTVMNHAPTADAGPNLTVTDNETFTVSGTGADPDVGDNLTYTWTFDNGSTVSGQNASHTYSSFGTYNATLTVTDEHNNSTTDTLTVAVVNHAPTIDVATVNRSNVSDGEPLQFNVSATDPDTGDALTYNWTFDDGNSSTTQNATHAYSAFGTYTVNVTVTDEHGATASTTVTVNVSNTAPSVADLTNTSVLEGDAVSYTANASDPDGDALSYNWTLGDGNTSAGVTVNHTYAAEAAYTVEVVVTDEHGANASATATVSVTNAAPTANLTGPGSATPNETVTFNASASSDPDDDPLTYDYDFDGDGTYDCTGCGVNASHSYAASGTYNVTVNVTDGDGGNDTATHTVSVEDAVQTVDDFEDVDLVEYASTGGSESITTSTVHNGTYALELSSLGDRVISTSGLNAYPDPGENYTGWVNIGGSNDNNPKIGFGVQNASNYYQIQFADGPNELRLKKMKGGSSTTLDSAATGFGGSGTWNEVVVQWKTDGTIIVTVYDSSGNKRATVKATDTTYTDGGILFEQGNWAGSNSKQYFDNFSTK